MVVKSQDVVDDALRSVREAERSLQEVSEQLHTRSAHDAAAAAFAETLHEVLGERPVSVEQARRAALSAASSVVWHDAVGPLLTGLQARELLGGVSRQRLDQLVKAGQLLALAQRDGRRVFPAWQFDEQGRPLAALVAAHTTLTADGDMSPWSAASWCVHEHPELDGRNPRDWALAGQDLERLALAAARDAARFAQ